MKVKTTDKEVIYPDNELIYPDNKLSYPDKAGEDVCNKHVEAQKSPFTKDLGRVLSGQKLWGFAAWVDTRGVIHSWSPVFSCIIT